MKRLIFRMLAFLIDVFFVNLIIVGLGNISFINNHIDDINKASIEYNNRTEVYNKLITRCDEIFYDNYIDLSESLEIKNEYSMYSFAFYDIPVNTELEADAKDRVINTIKEDYYASYENYNCKINKYNIKINIIGIFISILYFGVFEWYLNGKTIGKKLLRLKTVDNKDIKAKIPLWKYLIKAILISEVIFTIANIICANMAVPTHEGVYNSRWYNQAYIMIYNIQYIYNCLLLILIFIRRDERSLHDILLGIRVTLFDKNNKEVTSRIFHEKDDNKTN